MAEGAGKFEATEGSAPEASPLHAREVKGTSRGSDDIPDPPPTLHTNSEKQCQCHARTAPEATSIA